LKGINHFEELDRCTNTYKTNYKKLSKSIYRAEICYYEKNV